MGARLVAEVLTDFTDVGHDPFRLLVRMAHTALDEDNGKRKARLYFGGRALLALTLRPDLAQCETGSKEWRGTYANVKKALRILVQAGAIERDGIAYTGENQVYRMTLKRNPEFAPAKKGGPRQKRGVELTPHMGSSTDSPERSSTDSPVGEEGSSTDSLEGSRADSPKEPLRNQDDLQERSEETCEEGLLLPTGSAHASVSSRPDSPRPLDSYEVASRRLARVPDHQERLFQAAIDALGPGASTTELAIYAASLLDPKKVPA